MPWNCRAPSQGALPELKEFERRARDAAPARLNWPAPRDAADAIDDAEYDLVMLARALETSQGGRYLVEANPTSGPIAARPLEAMGTRSGPTPTA